MCLFRNVYVSDQIRKSWLADRKLEAMCYGNQISSVPPIGVMSSSCSRFFKTFFCSIYMHRKSWFFLEVFDIMNFDNRPKKSIFFFKRSFLLQEILINRFN
jgi:hypothetical protein